MIAPADDAQSSLNFVITFRPPSPTLHPPIVAAA
jgi:hypothetical protein